MITAFNITIEHIDAETKIQSLENVRYYVRNGKFFVYKWDEKLKETLFVEVDDPAVRERYLECESNRIAYEKIMWFVGKPEKVFERLGYTLAADKAEDIENLFGDMRWINFLYWIDAISEKSQDQFDEIINHILGPIAEAGKAKYPDMTDIGLEFVIFATKGMTNSQKKRVMVDVLNGVRIDESVKKNKSETFDFRPIFDKIINDNADQFRKCLENEKLDNWFVGQVMKVTAGKANPQEALAIFKEIKNERRSS